MIDLACNAFFAALGQADEVQFGEIVAPKRADYPGADYPGLNVLFFAPGVGDE